MEEVTRPEFEEAIKRLEAEDNRQNHRLNKLEDVFERINSLTTSVEKLALSVETMTQEIKMQDERLEVLEHRDGETWRNIMRYGMTAAVGVVVGYVLEFIGIF